MATTDPLAKASATGANGEVDPKEAARAAKSIRGLEQAPSTQQQTSPFANWQAVRDALGEPFNNERIAISKLRLMRRDPMIGFGLHYQKVPLVRAPFYMDSTDPQAAAFMDEAVRSIWSSLAIQVLMKLEFGFQAIAKRFELRSPDSTYRDENGNEQPVWSTQPGNIQPVMWKPFVSLPPEGCVPMYDPSTQEFAGIEYTPPIGYTQTKAKGSGGSSGPTEFDIYHSLWATNEKESVFGNIYGYPRLGYAYPYWWSYWFRWAIADRAFEKKGDPAILIRHPDGEIRLEDGSTISNAEYALLMGDRLRAGAVIALPSTPYFGVDDKPSTQPEWSIEFVKGGVELDPFDKSFNYLDIMKLRAVFVPEQALIEGGGGTSSRNVADEMYQSLVEAQSILMDEILDLVNRFMIPHLMMINFPDKVAQGIKVKMKTRGFAAQDMEFLQQVIQLIGQTQPWLLGVDVREALRDMNMPLLDEKQFQQQLAAAASTAAAQGPGAIAPTTSSVGVVPTPGKAPSTNDNTVGSSTSGAGGSFTGFSYIAPLERIELAASNDFMESLPKTPQFEDKTVRALARQLWNLYRDFYRSEYSDFVNYLDDMQGDLALAIDDDATEELEFAGEVIREIARRVVDRWPGNADKLQQLTERTQQIITKIAERAAKVAKTSAKLEDVPDQIDSISTWVNDRVANSLAGIVSTVRSELVEFADQFLQQGNLSAKDLAEEVRGHFDGFPNWKSDRATRTEVRDAFNAGYLLAGQEGGYNAAQAIDAQHGPTDPECEDRDGKIFTIDQALREDEHPNGTLSWRLLPEPVGFSRVDEVPDAPDGSMGRYDRESNTVFLRNDISEQQERILLRAIGDSLA
jgi:methyl-accepting chemotaxis protein